MWYFVMWIREWIYIVRGFPDSSVGKESTCNAGDAGRCEFDSLVGKIPWRITWQPTPIFLPGEYPWTGERLQSIGSQRVNTAEAT